MKILDVFDAVREGSYDEFKHFYAGDANLVSKDLGLSLLDMAVVNDRHPDEKLKIARFLISGGADVNYLRKKDSRNALHLFYFSVLRPEPRFMLEMTELLVENGIDINAKDKYGAIPLKYAITVNKLPTDEIGAVYAYLLAKGSDFDSMDEFGKSCFDYAIEYSWRNGVAEMMEEVRHAGS